MNWTDNDVANLILVGKDVGIHLGESIVRKLSLGRSAEKDIDYLLLICNLVESLEHARAVANTYTDDNYSYINELISRIEHQRNRFRNI